MLPRLRAAAREVHPPHQAPAGLDVRRGRPPPAPRQGEWLPPLHDARQMPRRSSSQCRDVYHRPFTARDDDELARLHQRLGGARWTDISRAVYGRSSRVMKRRWRDLRKSNTFLGKMWRPLPAADQEDVGMDADLDSPASSSQHPYTGLLASAVASCSLSRNTVGSGARAHLHGRLIVHDHGCMRASEKLLLVSSNSKFF